MNAPRRDAIADLVDLEARLANAAGNLQQTARGNDDDIRAERRHGVPVGTGRQLACQKDLSVQAGFSNRRRILDRAASAIGCP